MISCCNCCVHVVVISYHQPSGQCNGNEVQRVSQVILHSGGVHVCVCVTCPCSSPLYESIPVSLLKDIPLLCLMLSQFISLAVDFNSMYNVLVHPP